ncbi:hypothetical protein, partial [Snodgrassella alvi]|uniref:hypothetical protein n=1 Tax=Snodgrassella alvi TaxID=1196083 RepID=UPI0015D54B37
GNIAVKELHNLNNHFALEEYLAEQRKIKQYKYPGRTEKWTVGVDGKFNLNNDRAKFTFNDGSTAIVYNRKMRQVKWWNFTRKTYKQRVKESDPGQIIIGGNLNIAGSHWENNNSQILVGGNLIGTDNLQLDNIETKGQQRVEDKGRTGHIHYEKKKNSVHNHWYAYEGKGSKYSDTTTTTIDLDQPVSIVQQHTAIGGNQGKASTANPTGHEAGNIKSNNQTSVSNNNIAQQHQQ